MPSQFLSGSSAASGIALINSIGSLGGFAGSYLLGLLSAKTGSFQGGLAVIGGSFLFSAALAALLPRQQRVAPEVHLPRKLELGQSP